MKKVPSAAFTMVEMMVVMAIIVILASLVSGISRYVMNKGKRARAQGEIEMLISACESYKVDNGSYPRHVYTDSATGNTDASKSVTDYDSASGNGLSPKLHFVPGNTDKARYAAASLFLYKELTGERTDTTMVDGTKGVVYGTADSGAKRYLRDLDPRILKADRDPNTKAILNVAYFQDPFGNCYGYSTAAAAAEQTFQLQLKQGTATARPTGTSLPGFNTGSFDIWSTGGSTVAASPTVPVLQDLEWSKWLKIW